MNAACEQDMYGVRLAPRDVLQQRLDHGLPEGKTAEWTDVPAALAPLEHEPASALREKTSKERGHGRVEIRGDALRFQRGRQVNASPCDQCEPWPNAQHFLHLLTPQFGGQETEDAH